MVGDRAMTRDLNKIYLAARKKEVDYDENSHYIIIAYSRGIARELIEKNTEMMPEDFHLYIIGYSPKENQIVMGNKMAWNDKLYYRLRHNYNKLHKKQDKKNAATDKMIKNLLDKDITKIKEENAFLERQLEKRLEEVFER